MPPDLQANAEAVLGYAFNSVDLLRESLTHSSIADNRLQSNERMEFLGDAVLDLIVCELLYKRFPTLQEGDLTKIKSAVVSRKICAEVATETGLADLLIIGKGISNRSMMPSSLAAAVYESVVAAIYLDGGFEKVKDYVRRTMTPKVEAVFANLHRHNYKALLQQQVLRSLRDHQRPPLSRRVGPEQEDGRAEGGPAGARGIERRRPAGSRSGL